MENGSGVWKEQWLKRMGNQPLEECPRENDDERRWAMVPSNFAPTMMGKDE